MTGVRETIAAVGAGRMGRGIAHVFAYAGHPVLLIDVKPRAGAAFERLAVEAIAEIEGNLRALADCGLFEASAIPGIIGRIEVLDRDSGAERLPAAAMVFEGVPEVIGVKRPALDFIFANCSDGAVVASTTSTILVDTLAEQVPAPERFLNAHWLNPAYLVPLVEVSPGAATLESVTARLMALLEAVGKVPVKCAAAPGYMVPRIQALAMNEAARMVGEGVASAEDLDKAVRYGFGFRFAVLGLVEFIDWGGNDILYYASHYLKGALNAPRFEPPEAVDRNMREGRNGLREGRGFYDFESMDVPAYQRDRLNRFVGLLTHMGLARPPAK